jgi:hypothetical protein
MLTYGLLCKPLILENALMSEVRKGVIKPRDCGLFKWGYSTRTRTVLHCTVAAATE